mmetsp:Transcript_37780/g.90749  ORF Transcript_37780/g.90749 Transcript_37780/m.90749 type:complete len:356 (-) Transcript_37780:8-1075(-)
MDSGNLYDSTDSAVQPVPTWVSRPSSGRRSRLAAADALAKKLGDALPPIEGPRTGAWTHLWSGPLTGGQSPWRGNQWVPPVAELKKRAGTAPAKIGDLRGPSFTPEPLEATALGDAGPDFDDSAEPAATTGGGPMQESLHEGPLSQPSAEAPPSHRVTFCGEGLAADSEPPVFTASNTVTFYTNPLDLEVVEVGTEIVVTVPGSAAGAEGVVAGSVVTGVVGDKTELTMTTLLEALSKARREKPVDISFYGVAFSDEAGAGLPPLGKDCVRGESNLWVGAVFDSALQGWPAIRESPPADSSIEARKIIGQGFKALTRRIAKGKIGMKTYKPARPRRNMQGEFLDAESARRAQIRL